MVRIEKSIARLGEALAAAGKEKDAQLRAASAWLAEERAALKAAFEANGDAQAMLEGHSRVVDGLIAAFYAQAAGTKKIPVALVAAGGYGRRELYPYSDIDLLLLYDRKGEKEAQRIAEHVFYRLWDLGFKVGQAHRSMDEAIAAAREDMTIRTSLLDSRLIAGDEALFEAFRKRFANEIITGSEVAFIDAKLAERDARHRRFGDSRYMLEPSVKEGKGGLRDLHTLWWLACYVYPIRAFDELVGMQFLTQEEYDTCDVAAQFLRRVRIHLHYIAGRAEERLTFDRQLQVANAMGFAHPSANYAIARFMRRYFIAVRTVGNVTRIFCALLEEDKKRTPRKVFTWLWQNPWTLGGFWLQGERLTVRHDAMFAQQPVLMLEMFRVAQRHDLDIHPRALQLVSRNLPLINAKLQNDPEANAIFLDILLSGKGAETTLRRMSEAGVLGKFIPDFGRVIGMTQFNMYHVYTVDEHTLVALGILHAIEKGTLRDELPLATDVANRVRMRRVLYVSLLCHDIAKGRGGDHSLLGEKIAYRLCERFGFSREETETAAWLVRHHLLFSNTVFKRDINDPKTVSDFVEDVQNSERLKLLLVLTVADMRAVAPGVWNHWKGALLRDLYWRAEEAMGTGSPQHRQQHYEQLKQELGEKLAGWEAREVEQYLELGNPGMWSGCTAEQHAMVARMLREAEAMPLPLAVQTRHDYNRSISEITLVTADQHGLFSKIAGAVSLAGANIITAKIFTLKNGIAVEMFQVQDMAGGAFDRPEKLAKMAVYIEQALSGKLKLAEAFADKEREYRKRTKSIHSSHAQVLVDNEASNTHTVIEVAGPDRIGLLYQLTRVIADLGLSIATAHISTYGVQASDVFYVKDVFGMRITHEAKLKIICDSLRAVMMTNGQAAGGQKAP